MSDRHDIESDNLDEPLPSLLAGLSSPLAAPTRPISAPPPPSVAGLTLASVVARVGRVMTEFTEDPELATDDRLDTEYRIVNDTRTFIADWGTAEELAEIERCHAQVCELIARLRSYQEAGAKTRAEAHAALKPEDLPQPPPYLLEPAAPQLPAPPRRCRTQRRRPNVRTTSIASNAPPMPACLHTNPAQERRRGAATLTVYGVTT